MGGTSYVKSPSLSSSLSLHPRGSHLPVLLTVDLSRSLPGLVASPNLGASTDYSNSMGAWVTDVITDTSLVTEGETRAWTKEMPRNSTGARTLC